MTVKSNQSNPPDPRPEVESFAAMMETRLQYEEAKGRLKTLDKSFLLTKLFDEVHEIQEAIASGRDPSVAAASLACITMRIVESCGRLSTTAVRRGSMRTVDVMKESVKDSSSKYAVIANGKCTLWDANLETDFKITDESLLPILPAIRIAMKSLHDRKIHVGRIVVMEHLIQVFPRDGEPDPRSELEKAPIPDTTDSSD
jgi:hypothetical protein